MHRGAYRFLDRQLIDARPCHFREHRNKPVILAEQQDVPKDLAPIGSIGGTDVANRETRHIPYE